MLAPFFARGRFLGACGASCHTFWPAWLVFMRLGTLRARFWKGFGWLQAWFWSPNNLFFNVFTRYCASVAQMLRPLENIGRSGTKRTLELVRDTTPASKIDDEHNPRANIAAAGTPGFILDGHGHAPGVSWALLGRSWARLGRSWAPLGRFLAASWALLGVFWLVSGASWMHLRVQGRPGPLF